ncbi:hypothetical protein WDU94_010437 [Cyamophila willieti]
MFPLPFETALTHVDTVPMIETFLNFGYWICAVYILLIFGTQRWMKHRPKFDLRKPLILWNACLAIFSICGTFRISWHNMHFATNTNLHEWICMPNWTVDDVANYWYLLFALSKLPELGDTVFIVLRKQPLIFLHWYHHVTVFLYSSYSYVTYSSTGRLFCNINYFVHSLMYTYYAFRAMGYRPPKMIAMSVTFLQITQMVVGLVINLLVIYYRAAGLPCAMSSNNNVLSMLMYGSYFILFSMFFCDAYLKKKVSATKKDKKK